MLLLLPNPVAGSTQFQNDYPGLYQWIKKMEERPAYKTSIEKGGLYVCDCLLPILASSLRAATAC